MSVCTHTRHCPRTALLIAMLALPLGCDATEEPTSTRTTAAQATMRTQQSARPASEATVQQAPSASYASTAGNASTDVYDKPGFQTQVEDGRLLVMRPGQTWGDKHITLIGAGPDGMTLKALDRDTATAYMASKPGFVVEVHDGRLHVMKPGETWGDKHITLIGAGPRGETVKALSRETALEYLAAKPGFVTQIEDERLWVLKPGETQSEKHITLIGAGPNNMSIKAVSRETALEYLAAKPGFEIELEDGRLWVLKSGQEKSEKHITAIGRGPLGSTIKAIDRATLEAYFAAQS